ncbi:MAG TPA: hypothetical protein DCZ01_07480 [Elusimicrobia bacterium]|nr:MAG: hypothetical protein A2X37_06485 [Elusimicrobia bacterium GWA2_66_18]OGR72337.1 MAG: hypothetical protein A2X40_07035 [Elusimicrobia bacterium GWC2_65_9]HAZ08346.1 hypothetical protein [Elusimicrobiota bacterium]
MESACAAGALTLSVVVGHDSPDALDALRILVVKALHGAGEIVAKAPAISDDLAARLAASGPGARQGVSVLIAPVSGLREGRPALGVWRHCLRGAPPGHEPLQVIFVYLTPLRTGNTVLPSWARRALEDGKVVYRLKNATSVRDALFAMGLA